MIAGTSSGAKLAWLLLICGLIYLVTASGHFSSTDEEDLFSNTRLLAHQIHLTALPIGQEFQRGPQEIGQSLLATPLYLLANWITSQLDVRWHDYTVRAAMTLFNIGVTLATVAAIYGWVRVLYSAPIGLAVAATYGLATLAWPYSRTFYREPLVGLCLFMAFWAVSRFRQRLRRDDFLAAIGYAGLAMLTKITAVLALPWLLLAFYYGQAPKRKNGAAWQVGASAALLLLAVAVLAIAVAPKQEVLVAYLQEFLVDFHQGAGSWLSYGLRGLLVSPGKGLLITTPPVILAGLGLVPFFRRYRAESLAVVGLFLTLVLFYSTRRGWHGGACWGPRYLLPAMPLLMLPVGAAFDMIGGQIGPRACCLRAACWIVFVVGLLVQVAAVSVSPLNYYETIYGRGIIREASLDGGPAYLREIYFDPRYSPVWGQAQLAVQRSLALARGTLGSARPLPNTAAELNEYFATEETLDFWWIHLLMQISHRGGDLP